MKIRMMMSAMLAMAVVAGSLWAADVNLDEVKCPVSGQPVNPEATVEYNGGKVYFCCNNCPKAFKADTAKFAAKANHQLALTGQIHQAKCPISGQDLNPDTAIDVQGVKVAFCCKNCKAKVEKAEGDEQLELVFGESAKGWEAVEAEAK